MITAMILAAGRGERLRPITDRTPKPLCQIGDHPILAYHLAHLSRAGYRKVVINHAHLGWQIKQYVKNNCPPNLDIIFSPEPPGALETGGGIVNALPLLGEDPFITLNGDIYCDYDLRLLKLPIGSLAHVILVEKPKHRISGDYGLAANGLMHNLSHDYIFSGITVYHPRFFKQAMLGRYSVTQIMRQITDLHKVTGELYQGVWFDIGSFEQLDLAAKTITHSP